MKMKWLTLATATALALAACGDKSAPAAPAGNNTPASASGSTSPAPAAASVSAPTSEAKPEVSAANFLADAAALQAAEDALKALPQFGGKPVNIFQNIHFYGGSRPRIIVEIQDPNNPENIDHYEFEDGKWSEPAPVRISGDGKMKDNVYPLSEIKFADVAKIANVFSEKAKEVGAKETELEHVYYSLFVPTGKKRWYVGNLETERAAYQFEFNKDGTLKSFKKS